MAKKRKDSKKKIDIQFKRQKDGYASTRYDWQPTTGHAYREQIKGKVPFPPQRKADIFK